MSLLSAAVPILSLFACGGTEIVDPTEAYRTQQPQVHIVEQAVVAVPPAMEPAPQLEPSLGGPCLATFDFRKFHELTSQVSQAQRRQDGKAAVALAKEVVRSNCDNEHWWLKLAELQMEASLPADAVATLSAYDARNGNAVDRRLRTADSPLHVLLEQEDYLETPLARKIALERKSLDVRRAAAVAELAIMTRPADNYVAEGACPFECCMYGEWTVLEATMLYREADTNEAVGTVEPGQVQALGGEVRLRPTPVLVRYGTSDGQQIAEPGMIVFLLDYMGEGWGNVWGNGTLKVASWRGVQENCSTPSGSCWGEFIDPADADGAQNAVWWIQIKTPGGAVGWTRESSHFTGAYGCG